MHEKIDIIADDCKYSLVVNGKYVVLAGNSGTGKTYLCEVLNRPRRPKVVPPHTVLAPNSMELLEIEVNRQHGAFIVIDESVKVIVSNGVDNPHP